MNKLFISQPRNIGFAIDSRTVILITMGIVIACLVAIMVMIYLNRR
ncbi:hypothetical protein [Nicoliella lavandulae]|uniref:Uncharacterized protein n=1 Tax=Nicoliella lavandulae TaxID=3082954 RepID=A0ABU8SMR1_9LACO